MKYSYTIVLVFLIFYQVVLILATNDRLKNQPNDSTNRQLNENYLDDQKQSKILPRSKRQVFRSGLSPYFFKRNDNYEDGDELDEQELNSNSGKNQKKNKAFVSWGGKRSIGKNVQEQNNQKADMLNNYSAEKGNNSPLPIKRIRSEKPFRTWGGKKRSVSNYVSKEDELNTRFIDYLKKLEAINLLINELEAQNFD